MSTQMTDIKPPATVSEPQAHDAEPATGPSEPQAVVQKWTVAVLAALGLILMLVIAAAITASAVQRAPARPVVNVVHVSGGAPVQKVLYLWVTPGIKPGADGQLHDAYSQTTFTVHAGQAVKLVIHNSDSVPHSIVSPAAGVDIVVKPGTHSYSLLVKHQGSFQWHCNLPCDPYSMGHLGYMMGTIVAD